MYLKREKIFEYKLFHREWDFFEIHDSKTLQRFLYSITRIQRRKDILAFFWKFAFHKWTLEVRDEGAEKHEQERWRDIWMKQDNGYARATIVIKLSQWRRVINR